MTREDAIKHLENMKWLLGVNNTTVDDIPLTKVIDDIEALLKAQEAVEPIENAGFYYCGACRYAFTSARQKYCSECGRAVKWE